MNDPSYFDGDLSVESRTGEGIRSLDDWKQLAAPAGKERQWKEYRSAREAAWAWVGRSGKPSAPEELSLLLETRPETSGMSFARVIPEARLPLDRYRGNTRNTDFAAYGRAKGVPTLIAIEAKADESFGPTLEGAIRSSSESSNRPARIHSLCETVFGRPFRDLGFELADVRYQLVHGLAGALFEAERTEAAQAAFVVHEFRSSETTKRRLDANKAALDNFIAKFGHGVVEPRKLLALGEFRRGDDRSVRMFIGKVVTNLS